MKNLTDLLTRDPIGGRFFLDVATISLIAEIALGDEEEGEYTTQFLADALYQHIERIFNTEFADDRKKSGIKTLLELNLRTLALGGHTSNKIKGYSCLGTIFVKRVIKDTGVSFAFKRHPEIFKICSY